MSRLVAGVLPVEIRETIRIVRMLADGKDPATNSPLPAHSPYQNGQVVRALMMAVRLLEVEEQRRARNAGPNSFSPWTRQKDEQLCQEFQKRTDFNEIARLHRRSRGTIVSRLTKLGKLPPYGSRAA